MKTPNVGDVVTVVHHGDSRPKRANIVRSYKRRFIVTVRESMPNYLSPEETYTWTVSFSFERRDEGRTWARGWDTETSIAFRAEKALAACR